MSASTVDTSLVYAARKGMADEVHYLIESGADPNARDGGGLTGLIYAACAGYNQIVDLLLSSGADPNLDRKGWTPLMSAVHGCNVASIKALVCAGADINAADEHGRTALIMACARIYATSAVKALLDLGANPHIRSKENKSAWDEAEDNEHGAALVLFKSRPP
jgi:ankyrin repeat protein